MSLPRTIKPWRLTRIPKARIKNVYGVAIGKPLTDLELLMAVIRFGRAGNVEGRNYQVERRDGRRWEPCFPGMS